ncbi:pantetheine-phosphate adenylyltransferase [Prevotella sp. oral taxon 317 str. F0108]|nr:pantetheine-phosphate adenylyltransferase [Prevotella sp. oral taxon 317 str. F0108]
MPLELRMKTGLFTGSFDPFTIGHQSIVARVLPLFDKIVIGVGVNERKKYMYSAEVRVKEIAELYADNPKVEVRAFNDLAVDFAHREGAWFFVKGVRSVKDFEYEREQADINRMMGGIETLLVFAEPQHASVSSSLVRELIHFGKNAEMFLPKRKNKK